MSGNIQMAAIINNALRWDGTHLGVFPTTAITNYWLIERVGYYGITLPPNWSVEEFPPGIIYCNAMRMKDMFPCIVEDLKTVFNIPRRGLHRITLGNHEYILYYVPISVKGHIIWETPLSRVESKHPLRQNPNFRRAIQRVVAFCDILALSSTGEPAIKIRPGVDGEYIPINFNEASTDIVKKEHDFSILSKTIFSKWFGEETSISEVVCEMVQYRDDMRLYHHTTSEARKSELVAEMTIFCAKMRDQIDRIIKQYDRNYAWYACFIIDRMSRHILHTISFPP